MNLSLTERLRRKIANKIPTSVKKLTLADGVLSLTIDDFPQNAWSNGGPVLAHHGVKATFYVSGGLCGRDWLGLQQYDLATLKAVHRAGHEIACHTFDHINCVRSSPQAFLGSITRNKAFIAGVLPEVSLTNFAFPYGDIAFVSKLRTANRFASCRGVRAGINTGRIERANLYAIGLERRQMHLHDFPRLVAETARSRGWLILFTHDVSDHPSSYGCRPADLDRVVSLAKRAGLRIAPVKEVVSQFAAAG